jgi:hypothetical protein
MKINSLKAAIALVLVGSCVLPAAHGQGNFSSGSTGSDGALSFDPPPLARYGHEMAYDSARQRIVMFGGTTANGVGDNETWEWDGTRWNAVATPNSPSPRAAHAMAYDAERNKTILFGGYDLVTQESLNDSWEYDGVNWNQLSTPIAPSPRNNHAIGYDAKNKRIVLFGGEFQAGGDSDETWEWDGTQWIQKTPSSVPTSRQGHAVVYDSAREEIVMFGGYQKADTWTWDGLNWTQRDGIGPIGNRWNAAMAFDSSLGEVILFGGKGSGFYNDTWSWSGSGWSQKTPNDSPPVRNSHAMAYDTSRNRLVMYGGSGSIERYSDTWTWDGTNWSFPLGPTQSLQEFDMAAKPDGVWNFTTIDVPAGVTVRFKKNAANTPVVWLAQGDVRIDGGIDLDGSSAVANVAPGNEAPGGPGGFAGGLGGRRFDISGVLAGTPGQGPGGGGAGTTLAQFGGNAGYRVASAPSDGGNGAPGGQSYGNNAIIPLIGGSGAGGAAAGADYDGGNGGGGGGAILIASSSIIRMDGSIHADGGHPITPSGPARGGYGSGGAIRLVSPIILGGGSLSARVGVEHTGRIRLEAISNSYGGSSAPAAIYGFPISSGLEDLSAITIVTIAGQAVPQPPGGLTSVPDVVFAEAGPVDIELSTTNVPPGTEITVRVTAAGQALTTTATTDSFGNATATLTVPAGVGTVQAYAEYAAP